MTAPVGSEEPEGLRGPAAAILNVLFGEFLVADPAAMNWLNRDRLLVSAGQCSATLLAALHLAGYPVAADDLRAVGRRRAAAPPAARRAASPASIANAVSLAMAESIGASRLNRVGAEIIDHRTFALVSAADLAAGPDPEPIALAGLFALGKLIVYCDCSATGPGRAGPSGATAPVSGEYVSGEYVSGEYVSGEYFARCGWQLPAPVRVSDLDGIGLATRAAMADTTRPTLIRIEAPAGQNAPGGAPGTVVPEFAGESWASFRERGARRRAAWDEAARAYHREHPIGSGILRRWSAQARGHPLRFVTGDGQNEPALLPQELVL
jgi:transketolase